MEFHDDAEREHYDDMNEDENDPNYQPHVHEGTAQEPCTRCGERFGEYPHWNADRWEPCYYHGPGCNPVLCDA